MTKKEHYESPSMEVVELRLQGCLLAGSGNETFSTGDIPDGNAYGGSSIYD